MSAFIQNTLFDRLSWNLFWFVLTILAVSAPAAGRAEELAVSRFDREGLNGWEPEIFKNTTDYRLTEDDGRTVVRATSRTAASGLVKKIEFDPAKYRYLRWSWKIERTIENGNEKSKSGDDYAARLYVIFPGRFFWQTRAINYIWANRLPKGESIANAYTGQAMMVAVQSGSAQAGKWLTEERNIWEDYRRLFGEEARAVGAVAIMTDTDDTGGSAVAWYGDIVISTFPN